MLLPISLVAIVVLWLWSGHLRATRKTLHSLLCVFSDLCPSFLVLAAAILFLTYSPFDSAYRQMLQGPFSPESYQEFARAAHAPFALPMSVEMTLDLVSGPHGRFLWWCGLTSVLILSAAVFVYRLAQSFSGRVNKNVAP
jgi:uncharacterized membrane protein